MLLRLREAGLTLGVATSKPQTMAELLLNRAGLRERFDVIVGSKPGINNDAKWAIVQTAMGLCGAEPAATVLVGDTKYDAIGAARVGIPCIGAGWGYGAPGELEAAGVICTARDFEEVVKYLLE